MSFYDEAETAINSIQRKLDNADLDLAIAAFLLVENGVMSLSQAKQTLEAIREARK